MKRTRFFEPYRQAGKDWKATMSDSWDAKRSGVYFIKQVSTGDIVYVGQSQSQLKKTIYRHFQEWDDKHSKEGRIVYEKTGYQVRFIYCTAQQAARLEKYWIKKLKPRDNEQKYESFFDRLTAPSEESLKALVQKANLSPFMKREDYYDEADRYVDDGKDFELF